MYQSTEMLKNSRERNLKEMAYSPSTLLPEDSHARTLVQAVKELVSMIHRGKSLEADSGAKCTVSLARLSLDGSWLKMFGDSCQYLLPMDSLEGALELYSGTWPNWGMSRDGVVMGLTALEQSIKGEEYSLWPTPLASDGDAWLKINKNDFHYSTWKTVKNGHQVKALYPLILWGCSINQCAELYEMMMGYPRGWTDCDVLAIQ